MTRRERGITIAVIPCHAMRLGTLLLRDAVIGLSQLEEAVKAQVLYGGRLGTNLVELEIIDLDRLGFYLSKVHGVPLATTARLEAAPSDVVQRFGRELAERLTAFPLGPEPVRPDVIAVAMADPNQTSAIADIQARLGASIAPYVAPELRLLYYLESHYGIERPARYLRPGDGGAEDKPDERRRTRPDGAVVAPVVRLEPKRTARSAPAPRRPTATISAAEAVSRIQSAEHRDAIADALIEFCRGRSAAAALFIVRGKSAMGWRGLAVGGRILSGSTIEKLAVPLGGASVLQSAFDTRRPYHGPSISAGKPTEREIWAALGAEDASQLMLVVPVCVGNRVVNLLYLHAEAGHALSERECEEIGLLCDSAADAYLQLIQAARSRS